MRPYLLTVARSIHKACHLIQPFTLQRHPARICKAFTPWAFPTQSSQALRFSAREPVRLLDLKRWQHPCKALRMSSVETTPSAQTNEGYEFGPYQIGLGEVFLTTKLSFAFVNLRPVVPDVLVCPKRVVARFVDLSAEEVTDLWLTSQRVGKKLEPFFGGSSLTLAIQDGPEAGQTVPHVHVHILPRRPSDFKNNDDIYDEIDRKEKDLGETLNLDQERKDRTSAVMQEEATKLRSLF